MSFKKEIDELLLLDSHFLPHSNKATFHHFHFDVLESTQVYAETHEQDLNDFKPGEWRVVLADQQTKGQGTQGRSWLSPYGNIFATFSTVAPVSPSDLSDIPQAVAIAVMQVLKTYGVEPQYKWVNDVLIREKKISGIVCRAGRKIGENVILHIGIGVNIALSNIEADSLSQPVTSLNLVLGKDIDKAAFIRLLQHSLAHHFYCYLQLGRLFMADELNARLAFKGKNILFDVENNKKTLIQGILLGIDERGWIIIKQSDNQKIQSYHSGRILQCH